MKVAIYCRVSTAEQRATMEIEKLRVYSARRNWEMHAA